MLWTGALNQAKAAAKKSVPLQTKTAGLLAKPGCG
jgi:hypothetical protein